LSKVYYHGSIYPCITKLEACSILHQTNRRVVYLTDNVPYALYYIWDENITGYRGKHVTGWINGGTAYYEEQFPDQLKAFYQGVSGYLYVICHNEDIQPLENRDGMYYSLISMKVAEVMYIPDVYEELLKYESMGLFRVLRYNEQSENRQNELIELIASAIRRSDFFKNDESRANFMKKYFRKAWEKAEQCS
jgi:hypothetical protein